MENIGNGGFGKVYRAEDLTTKKYVAIKIIHSKCRHYELAKKYFKNETQQNIAALDHPYIIKVIAFSPEPFTWMKIRGDREALFIALELADGGDLFHYVNVAPFSEATARFYFRQLIEAVDHLHKKGMVHRDLKMENLLLDIDFNLKLADFGFSCPVDGNNGSGHC